MAAKSSLSTVSRCVSGFLDAGANGTAAIMALQPRIEAGRAQEQRAAALAEAAAVAAAKKARCAASSLSPDAAASLLEMLDGRVKGASALSHISMLLCGT